MALFNDQINAAYAARLGQKPGASALSAGGPPVDPIQQRYLQGSQELGGLLDQRPGYQSALDTDVYKQMRERALGTGDFGATPLLRQRAQMEGQRNLESLSQQQAGGQANAYSQLAMSGGLSSGARERIASGGMNTALLGRQAARQGTAQNLANIDIDQEGQRGQLLGQYAQATAADTSAKNQSAQDAYTLKAQTQAGLLKSRDEQYAAAANSCFLEGTKIEMNDGSLRLVDDLEIGDKTSGGEVYCVQKAYAHPGEIYRYKNTFVTGTHAVRHDDEWVRVHEVGEKVQLPKDKKFVFNFGVTLHFFKLEDGSIMGDLHETDDYEFLTDEESLDEMNASWREGLAV